MNIYTRLKKDHEKQRELCKELAKTQSGSENRANLWEELKVELGAHALAEEQVFYSAMMEKPDGTEEARHSVAEHKDMTDLIEELDAMDQSADIWMKKFEKLKHEVIHHVDEEEADIFPVARKVISKDAAEDMAQDFDKRKDAEEKSVA
ncbi:hemerythrin domain-containing protein [Robiginitomaculum antarcticum]|uniref:hemerythrin domain-containing protein n=1 Tax=Robiginitomaculum antarcticum TaxID=437507 RepID=UPI00037507AD|nr:hemerythrin domain-containing protein [Robiginitomaculum antarcticum]